jgi:ABC transport system ATP-binding/permease protein
MTDTIVTVDGAEKSHDGLKILFQDLSFTIARGERMAIIGENGSGKSSLLKIIAGHDDPDEGRVELRKQANVGYLSQDTQLPDNLSAFEAVVQADSPIARTVRKDHSIVNKGAKASKTVRTTPVHCVHSACNTAQNRQQPA